MCKQKLVRGARVIMGTPYEERGVKYTKGVIRSTFDGEYFLITVFILADETTVVERYFTDLRTE